MDMPQVISISDAIALCRRAGVAAGASEEVAHAMAEASVSAEASGASNVGIAHFLDYLDAIRDGRIDGNAAPSITRPLPCLIHSDARGGAAHTGFALAYGDIVDTARRLGLALFSQNNAYTCGELGYFALRLANDGFVALAATNGPALLAASGSTRPVFCTNPIAFAAPRAGGPPLLIDQASSETAFVNIRRAAREGKAIPEGWAIDENGVPTIDPNEAMKGALLAYGGARGANIALMVEILAAGVGGANWSIDAPSFQSGGRNPGTGLFILAVDASALDGGFSDRLDGYLARLGEEYGVHVPGLRKASAIARSMEHGISVDPVTLEALRRHPDGRFPGKN